MDANFPPASHTSPTERPEELLDAMARGDENLGERLLSMARAAATADRASIFDLLLDDTAPVPAASATSDDLHRVQESPSAPLRQGEREEGSDAGEALVVVAGVRRMEVAR